MFVPLATACALPEKFITILYQQCGVKALSALWEGIEDHKGCLEHLMVLVEIILLLFVGARISRLINLSITGELQFQN